MSRFDDAIVDLLADVGDGADLDGLTKRVRRHRRRRVVAVLAVLSAISIASVSVVASLGKSSNGLVVAGSTSTTAPAANTWCDVRLSRRDAIAVVMNRSAIAKGISISAELKSDTAHAKLMTWAEFRQRSNASSQTKSISDHLQLWVVEVQGIVVPVSAQGSSTYRPPPHAWEGSTYTWGVFTLDATNASLKSTTVGTGVAPSYWETLPDHASECPAQNNPTSITTPTPSFPECDPGLPSTFTAFDHATHLPVQISRAYYCRRLAELQPSPDAHLSGGIYVENGKVTAEYQHTTDVRYVDSRGEVGLRVVESTGTVPINQLPASLQKALSESPPAPILPAPGPDQPSDPSAARQAVSQAFAGAFDGAASVQSYVNAIEGGSGLVGVFDQLRRGAFAQEVTGAKTVIDAIVFQSPTTAAVEFNSNLSTGPSGPYFADAILTPNGWQVTHASYCKIVIAAAGRCP